MLQVIPPVPPTPAPEAIIVQSGPPAVQIAVVAVFAIIAGAIILYPLVRALARRLEGRGGSGDAQMLEARIVELEHRLADAEERLDFSERMLSQREPLALPRDKAD